MVLYLIGYDTLFQKTTDIIIKRYSYLLQNATKIYGKIDQLFYYIMQQFCYKMRQLLLVVTFNGKRLFTRSLLVYRGKGWIDRNFGMV